MEHSGDGWSASDGDLLELGAAVTRDVDEADPLAIGRGKGARGLPPSTSGVGSRCSSARTKSCEHLLRTDSLVNDLRAVRQDRQVPADRIQSTTPPRRLVIQQSATRGAALAEWPPTPAPPTAPPATITAVAGVLTRRHIRRASCAAPRPIPCRQAPSRLANSSSTNRRWRCRPRDAGDPSTRQRRSSVRIGGGTSDGSACQSGSRRITASSTSVDVLAFKRAPARQHLVQHAPEGPHVAALVGRLCLSPVRETCRPRCPG